MKTKITKSRKVNLEKKNKKKKGKKNKKVQISCNVFLQVSSRSQNTGPVIRDYAKPSQNRNETSLQL